MIPCRRPRHGGGSLPAGFQRIDATPELMNQRAASERWQGGIGGDGPVGLLQLFEDPFGA